MNKRRKGTEPRSGTFMRILRVQEVAPGRVIEAYNVPGISNHVADRISRWYVGCGLDCISADLLTRRHGIKEDIGHHTFRRRASPEMPLRRCSQELTRDFFRS